MKKVYKMYLGYLRYHQAYVHGGTLHERWGLVGEFGQERRTEVSPDRHANEHIANALKGPKKAGYAAMPFHDMAEIRLHYATKEWNRLMAPEEFLDQASDYINEVLCDTGLGHVQKKTSGTDYLIIICRMVDSEIGIRTLETTLDYSEFESYSRIFQSNYDDRIEDDYEPGEEPPSDPITADMTAAAISSCLENHSLLATH